MARPKKRVIDLTLLVVVLLLDFTTTIIGLANAELEYYQDEEPRLPQVDVQQLMRYLESKRHDTYRQPPQHQQNAFSDVLPQPVPRLEQYERYAQLQEEAAQQEQLLEQARLERQRNQQIYMLKLARQNQRDDLPERPDDDVLDVLQREAIVDPIFYVNEFDRQRLLPSYLGLDYEPDKQRILEDNDARTRHFQLSSSNNNHNPLLDYPEIHYEKEMLKQQPRHRQHQPLHAENPIHSHRMMQNNAKEKEDIIIPHVHRPIVPFTYEIPAIESVDSNGEPPIVVRPNDPRFFENDDKIVHHHKPKNHEHHDQSFVHDNDKNKEQIQMEKNVVREKSKILETSTRKPGKQQNFENSHKGDLEITTSNTIPEPQRRAEQNPLVESLNFKNNDDDVYFIAVVAGCSAVAMFGLVLISLTWCRIKRVSKAAADVEYPAYGITGPNKDMSPSNDQRLAQSAQMYHFQHQKQQIIAMENRASAAREAGSLSEPESDEENVEGDYTVYECPGLATTSEMEVKNPLFDDDPTPVSPIKSK